MKNGSARFDFFLNQLQALLDRSSKQKNPALWLYLNNVRTPLFMLEGLSKLYAGIHNKKKFEKIKAHFKLLEDLLGTIDYYDSFAKEFAKNKKIPATIVSYLQAQTREKIQSLNEALTEDGWLRSGNKRINKIRSKIKKADWEKGPDEIKSIQGFYIRSIDELLAFSGRSNFHFSNVESDVHELRRKLRWLSIYPQALRGVIQLSKVKPAPGYLTKYLTKDIITSPYNQMPDAAENTSFLLLEKNYFYALSWMIAELGKLKDSGLRVIAIKEAIQQLSTVSNTTAFKKAYSYAGSGQLPVKEVLTKADAICKTYFKEQNLQKLVIGTASTIK